ncbi:hypothetical protein BKA91DRAFT_136771 [Yarrowia lipolytica]|nr:hypothetical protein BKA91DRAFT_136771 [Yarrowia lipolytica]KAE8173302.1 hypothetical protein BKA90DRAFT_135862 [Yarrowia lipolytica]RMI95771.1 hypothetical protein BD777DRAFT_129672 [Yarrowia lipolytica]
MFLLHSQHACLSAYSAIRALMTPYRPTSLYTQLLSITFLDGYPSPTLPTFCRSRSHLLWPDYVFCFFFPSFFSFFVLFLFPSFFSFHSFLSLLPLTFPTTFVSFLFRCPLYAMTLQHFSVLLLSSSDSFAIIIM